MTFRVHPYHPRNGDLEALLRLIRASWHPQRHPHAYFHIGDLCWRLREPECEQTLWLWEDESGNLAGFAELPAGAKTLDLQIHPDYIHSSLNSEILQWSENLALAAQNTPASLATYASETDTELTSLLHASGYQREDFYYNHHIRRLDTPIEEPNLPEGYTVRSLRGPEEWPARIEGHRAGWQSTKMTAQNYERMAHLPGYRLDLDIVVEAPGAPLTFAATGNCWLDQENGVGLFEPVSTHPDHRRRGLARALVLYGMNHLRTLGAHTAAVCSVSVNPAATHLYEACQMPIARRDFAYSKTLVIPPG